jgi:hypothetical protein
MNSVSQMKLTCPPLVANILQNPYRTAYSKPMTPAAKRIHV